MTSTPMECLRRSHGVMALLLRPGDRIDGERIEHRLVDVDGSIVYLLEGGGYVEAAGVDEVMR